MTATPPSPPPSPRSPPQGSLRHPGECWSFVGSKGTLAVSLSHPIRITHVTMEHAQRSNSPTGEIKSAPRDFEVYVSVAFPGLGSGFPLAAAGIWDLIQL